MQGENGANGRNYGIDLLRLLSMLFVVLLHALGQGGLLAAAPERSAAALSGWFLEAFAFCAVDVFALISGYVGYSDEKKKTRLSSWLLLWAETVFYGVAVTLAFCLLRPDAVSLADLRGMYLPLKNDLYWYFTAYTGLFVIKPLLDAGLRTVSVQTARRCFLAVFVVFSLFDTCAPVFRLGAGYSFVWIALLYLLGAAMRKGGVGARMRPLAALACILGFTAVTWAWRVGFDSLPEKLQGVQLLSYLSPTVLGAAVCFLLLFAGLRIGKAAQRAIRFAAPGAFAVYLLNTHPLVWSLVLEGRFAALASKPAAAALALVLAFSLVFTAAALLIDKLRQLLVKLLRIDRLAAALGGAIERLVDRIAAAL